jgi:sugar phosphate isomerase/epimerase
MKPAICTGFDCSIPFAQCLTLIRNAGFEVVSIGARPDHAGYGTAEGRAAIRRMLAYHRLTAESVHAPFPEGDRLFSLDEPERLESIRQCQIAMDAAADLEARIVVTHLIQPYDIPHGDVRNRMIDQGRRSVATLVTYAAERQVKLAFENGQKPDYDQVVADFLTEFAAPHVGFCYDTGHENVQGTCFRFLERFGPRLFTLHVHDNQGWDSHILPYEGTIPWNGFCPLLRRIGYVGNLLLEVDSKNSAFKDPVVFLAEAYARAGRLLEVTAGSR